MFSDEEDFDDDDDLEEESDEFDTTDDNDDEEEEELSSQPIHFRECLRLLDCALSAVNPPIVPRWCGSEQIDSLDDPMILIKGQKRSLSLPMNKREARRFIRQAQPFDMKMDVTDGISFCPSAYEIPLAEFELSNPQWQRKVEPYLKESCVGQILELNPNEIQLKVSKLVLLKPCEFPREFIWPEDDCVVGKLFVSLPSMYRGGKETISFHQEKHSYDYSNKGLIKSNFFTAVPMSNECKHQIDLISSGYKLILIYDIIPLTSTVYYNVNINELVMDRVGRIFETWLKGLKENYHGYATKIVIPFSDLFQSKKNLLLYGIDRITGTILRRTVEKEYSNDLLLYQGIIQPNRSNDGTIHVCRLLTNLNLISNHQHPKANQFFQTIDSCLGNCNETYSGNIFLRKILSEQGQFLSNEQFNVPVWCLVPMTHKYDLIIDHIPRFFNYLEEHPISAEMLMFFHWLLTSPKKISFNSKVLLRHLIRLLSDQKISSDIILIIQQLFKHRRFSEEFFPMTNSKEYDDIIYLFNYSEKNQIQLDFYSFFDNVLQQSRRHTDHIKDAIQFIAILFTRNVNSSFLLVLVHQLLLNIFKLNQPIPSITDLTNLLALLSISARSYHSSCQIISQQIIRQIKITATTTTNTSTITHLLRAILIPTLIQIYQQFTRKRKRNSTMHFPSWFLSLYQTCLSLVNAYCTSPSPIPTYEKLPNQQCCSMCEQLFLFLRNSNQLEKTFLLPNDQIYHFSITANKCTPLLIVTQSMTSAGEYHQIKMIKMSIDDHEISRENNLLRSLLCDIPLSTNTEDHSEPRTRRKRFKSSI